MKLLTGARSYWMYGIPVWLFWSYLIIFITGDRFPVSSDLFIPFSLIAPWIFGVNILLTPLTGNIEKGPITRFTRTEVPFLLFLPLIFILALTIQDPVLLGATVLIICELYLIIRFIIHLSLVIGWDDRTNGKTEYSSVFLVLIQLVISLLPFLLSSSHINRQICSLLAALASLYIIYRAMNHTFPAIKTIALICLLFVSMPFVLAISSTIAWKEWIGTASICIVFLAVFKSGAIPYGHRFWIRTSLALIGMVLACTTSFRHIPVSVMCFFFMCMPETWKNRKLPVTLLDCLLLFIPLWLVVCSLYYSGLCCAEWDSNRFFHWLLISFQWLFGLNSIYILGPVWLLGLYGMWFLDRTVQSLGEILVWMLLLLLGGYAAARYPTPLPFLFFLPCLLISGFFIPNPSKHSSLPGIQLFTYFCFFATIAVSSIWFVIRLVSLTEPGSFFISLNKPDVIFRIVRNLISPDTVTTGLSSFLGWVIYGILMFGVFIQRKHRKKINSTQTTTKYYQSTRVHPVFIPCITLLCLMGYFYYTPAFIGNILPAPILLESNRPCKTITFSSGKPVGNITLISYASNSVTYPQGAPLARMKLLKSGSMLESINIRIGIETAEWAAERHDVKPVLRHKPVSIWNQYLEFHDGVPYARNIYKCNLPFREQENIDEVEICLLIHGDLEPTANLTIEAVMIW